MGTVVTFAPCSSGSLDAVHEHCTRTQVARRLAALKGFDFGDEYDASHQYANQPLYLVPSDTLSRAQLAALPQVDPDDPLFGGVVPYAFVATKAITHPLPHPGASAPKGWSTEFGKRVGGVVFRGFSAFDLEAARAAGRTLLAWGACEAREGRLVPAQAHLSKAFEAEPGNPTIALNLGEVLYRQGEYERARFYARRVNSNVEQANAASLWLELRIERRLGNAANMEDLGQQLRRKYPQAAETQALNNGRFDE